jgi:hypothetical protein
MSHSPFLLATVFALLWAFVVAPLILRMFGFPLQISWSKRQDTLWKSGLPQYVLFYGVMTFGMAGFVFFMAYPLFQWRFSEAWAIVGFVPPPFNAWWRMLSDLAIWVLCGVWIGWVSRKRPSNTSV